MNPLALLPAWRRWLPWLALGGLWLAGCATLSSEWQANPQYQFGWAVPLLCAWLGFSRWRDRPAPVPNDRAPVVSLVAIGVALWPVRLGLEAFPDWRPLLWLLAGGLVALTLCVLRESGGAGWQRHFAFPTCFVFTAVPWPTPVEAFVVHGLQRLNASVAVDLLTLFGHPAVQRGNIIEVGRGLIGVDEACSGLRSLQAALMLALLCGEIFRLRAGRRGALVLAGVVLALLTNLLRTLWLVALAAHAGPPAIDRVHDTAGLLTLAACVLGLGALGWSWRSHLAQPTTPAVRAAPAVSLTTALLLLALTGFGELGTELWYRRGDSNAGPRSEWAFDWPRDATAFRELAIRPAVREVLRNDHGRAAAWSGAAGANWTVHWLRWEPRPVRQAILAAFHTPDVCLPAAGCLLREELAPVEIALGPTSLRFRGYAFEEQGAPLFVFFLLHDDRGAGRTTTSVAGERLRLIWDGQRRAGKTELHVALRGVRDAAAARAAFEREIAPRISAPR